MHGLDRFLAVACGDIRRYCTGIVPVCIAKLQHMFSGVSGKILNALLLVNVFQLLINQLEAST